VGGGAVTFGSHCFPSSTMRTTTLDLRACSGQMLMLKPPSSVVSTRVVFSGFTDDDDDDEDVSPGTTPDTSSIS
jgi:hypothetical protein